MNFRGDLGKIKTAVDGGLSFLLAVMDLLFAGYGSGLRV